MKKVEAIIQPYKLEEVKEALKGIGVDGVTVVDVRGHGRQRGHTEVYRGAEYVVDFIPKIKIELLVEDDKAAVCAAVIEQSARTGRIGDGKIFVSNIEEAIRIRTGESGVDAI